MGIFKGIVRGIKTAVKTTIRKPKRGAASSQAAFNASQINYTTPNTYRAAVPVKPGAGEKIPTAEGAATVMTRSSLFRRRRGL